MADIATLQIAVDSKQLDNAKKKLQSFSQEAKKAQASAKINIESASVVRTTTTATKANKERAKSLVSVAMQQERVRLQGERLAQQNKRVELANQRLALQEEKLAKAINKSKDATDGKRKSFSSLGSVTDVLSKSIFNIKNLIGTVFVFAIGKSVDQMTALETKIGNVTRNSKEMEDTMKRLFAAAQDSSSSYQGLGDAFTKLNVSLPQSVKNTTDLVKVTELLGRGLAAGGAGAQTSAGVLLQLTQGLATDFKAAGQELNSLIEGSPLLASVIAKELGGRAATDLKVFAEQGKLSSKAFLDALLRAEDAIKAFKIPKTIGNSWQRLRNVIDETLRNSSGVRSIFSGIASAVDLVANSFEGLLKTILTVTVAVGSFFTGIAIVKIASIVKGINLMTAAMAAFNFVAVANPFGIIATGIGLAIAATTIWGEELSGLLKKLGPFGEKTLQVFKDIAFGAKAIMLGVAQTIVGIFNGIIAVVDKAINEVKLKLYDASVEFSKVKIGGKSVGQIYTPKDLDANRLKQSFPEAFGEGFGKSEDFFAGFLMEESIAKVGGLREEIEKGSEATVEWGRQFTLLSDVISKNVQGSVDNLFDSLIQGTESLGDTMRKFFADILADMAKLVQQQARSGISGFLTDALGSILGGFMGPKLSDSATSLASKGSLFNIPGMATGGSFEISGNAGNDNNLMSINGKPVAKVSKGEKVSVSPNSGGANNVIYYNIDARGADAGVEQRLQAVMQRINAVEGSVPSLAKMAVQDEFGRNRSYLR